MITNPNHPNYVAPVVDLAAETAAYFIADDAAKIVYEAAIVKIDATLAATPLAKVKRIDAALWIAAKALGSDYKCNPKLAIDVDNALETVAKVFAASPPDFAARAQAIIVAHASTQVALAKLTG